MTNNGDPYENAVAKRIIGILKQEFVIASYHADLDIMRKIVQEKALISITTKDPITQITYTLPSRCINNQTLK